MTAMTQKRSAFLALPLAAVVALSACAAAPRGGSDATEGQTPSEGVGSAAITTDLEAPWSMAFVGETALISERDSARILELDEAGGTREVGVIDGVQPRGEGGLLGIAVHDDFLYAYSTSADGNRIERSPLTGEPGGLGLGDPEVVLDGIPAAGYHNGGRIAFGPDGMLYATAGDAGDTSSAQDTESLAGKILRMTPEGEIPDDNPFDGSYAYSYGHRNPQGIAWDDDGTMYASEFGQDTWDELNVIEAGQNYGWPEVEGIVEDSAYADPVQQWEPAEASPSGITIADGSIWIANLRGERLREIPLDDLAESAEHWVGEHGRLRDVVTAPDGTLRVLTNNTDGRGDPREGDDRVLQHDAIS